LGDVTMIINSLPIDFHGMIERQSNGLGAQIVTGYGVDLAWSTVGSRPGGAVEVLVVVPGQVGFGGFVGGVHGVADGAAVKAHEEGGEPVAAPGLLRDLEDLLRGHGVEPAVEGLVVEAAQGQCIDHVVGAAGRVPADVRGLHADGLATELDVEPAHRAAPFASQMPSVCRRQKGYSG